jgi:dTDP-4-dehydrorhamnose 3,5-epimerase
MSLDVELPVGMALHTLERFEDERGDLVPIFAAQHDAAFEPRQWNLSRSVAGTLRGVHVHHQHDDYLVVIAGEMLLGLHDMRGHSPTAGLSTFVTLRGDRPTGVTIPSGVCHGFYFPVESTHIYATTTFWDGTDELGCRFDAPELGLPWPDATPILSTRDAGAGDYAQMKSAFMVSGRL